MSFHDSDLSNQLNKVDFSKFPEIPGNSRREFFGDARLIPGGLVVHLIAQMIHFRMALLAANGTAPS